MNTTIFSCVHEERLKALHLEQLLSKENKSAGEIQEMNELVAEKKLADEMAKEDVDFIEAVMEETKYLSVEDVDFMIGTIYGMSLRRTMDKDWDEQKKNKRIKLTAQMFLQMRQGIIEKIKRERIPSSEKPKKNS